MRVGFKAQDGKHGVTQKVSYLDQSGFSKKETLWAQQLGSLSSGVAEDLFI